MPSPPQGGILGILPIPVGLGGSLASGGGIPTAAHFWPMTEGIGSTVFDSIGGANLTSFASWITTPTGMGPSASIASFSGGGQNLQSTGVVSNLNFNGITPFTVSVWIYPTTSTYSICGNLNSASNFEGWELSSGGVSGQGLLLVNNVTTNQMTALNADAPTLSTAQFLTVTYTGSLTLAGVQMYLNGILTPVTDSTGTLSSSFTSPVAFFVGSRSNSSNAFAGAMAYMRTWNQVLTPAQVTALFALGPQ